MVKNKLEKMFSKSIKTDSRLWGMKLHNNPLAHQNTPADYIITTSYGLRQVHLVECKQVTCKRQSFTDELPKSNSEGKGRLAHKRLKQMHDLIAFEAKFPGYHKSWWCIAFYDGSWSNSDVYIIPANVMEDAMLRESKVSFNRDDMKRIFAKYGVSTGSGVIAIWNQLQ